MLFIVLNLRLVAVHLILLSRFNTAGQLVDLGFADNVSFPDDLIGIRHQKHLICHSTLQKSSEIIQPNIRSLASTSLELPSASISIQLIETDRGRPKDAKENKQINNTFISFDEWRVAKLNEELHDKRERLRVGSENSEGETIGEDLEVELGFFASVEDSHLNEGDESDGDSHKHMFNFASLDCAATIVKTNSEASGASSILNENKDKYLLNPCSVANKFIVTELCQDILVEEIAIANYEFFSSTFHELRFSVSDRYPVAKNGWTSLGEFEAANTRNLQTFSIQNPKIWARYLRVDILSHHGNEFYCPISLLRVHGKTMIDEFKMDNSKVAAEGTEIKPLQEENLVEDNSKEVDETVQCDFWPSIEKNNITSPPRVPHFFERCKCRLKPLKFEEFLRDLNETSCPASVNQNTPTVSTTSTEESIFKNIMKRLGSLEANTSLSVLYMEEQSKLLSNSFDNLEKAQANKFDNLVSIFNDTMMENLNVLRIFANQLKDQSIKIIEEQKLNNDQFTTQYVLRTENLERELRLQRNVVYFIVLILMISLIYKLLCRDQKVDENSKRLQLKSSYEPVEDPASPVTPISLVSGSSAASD